MMPSNVLKQYIDLCYSVIESNDFEKAKALENEIVSIFGNDIRKIKSGLSRYEPYMCATTVGGETYSSRTKVNYLEDIRLLKNKLQVEYEKNFPENSKSVSHNKPKKVFVSHSSNDKSFVEPFVNLLEDIGLSENEIVCSSIPEYGIPLGNDIYDWLSEQFQNFDLHIIFILSVNYYDSIACLNEMGAAWVLKQKYDAVLLPGFDFLQIKGAINPQQIGIKLDSDFTELNQRLNELKDSLIEEFELNSMSTSKWERYRNEFVEKVTSITNQTQNNKNTDNYEIENLISNDAAILLVYAANDKSGRIIMVNSLSGLSVNAGKWNFVDSDGGTREEARWDSAVDELESYGLVEDGSYKHQVFAVTHIGYQVADKLKEKLNVNFDNSPDQYLIKNN